jgi:PAS domain S-box-containing protein
MSEPHYDKMSKKALIDRLIKAERQLRTVAAEIGSARAPAARRRSGKISQPEEHPDPASVPTEAKRAGSARPAGGNIKSASESDYTILDKDGRIRRLYKVVKDIRDDAGNPVFSEGALYEINSKSRTDSDVDHPDIQGESDHTELICRFRPNGSLTYVNEAYCRYFGVEKEDLRGRNALLSISESDREKVYARLKDLRPERPVDTFEYRVATVFGDVLWNQWTYRALFDDGGNILEYQSVGRDITFRKYTQDILEKRAAILEAVTSAAEAFLKSTSWRDRIERVLERFGAAMNASHVFLCENRIGEGDDIAVIRNYEWLSTQIKNDKHRTEFLRNSKLAVRFSRWVYEKSEGRPIVGTIGQFPDKDMEDLSLDRKLSIAVMPVLIGERWWGFMGFADYSGDIQWGEDEIAPLGAASEILGAAIEREEKEQALRETHATILDQERFLAGVFDAIQDGIMVTAPDMTILRVNKTIESRFSHVPTLLGRKCHEAYYGLESPCACCASQETLNTGKGASMTRAVTGPDGECKAWVEVFSYPWVDHDTGQLKGVIEYSRDITEKKRAEEALQQQDAMMRSILRAAPVGIAFGRERTLQWSNEYYQRMTGYGEDDVSGRTARLLYESEEEFQRVGKEIYGNIGKYGIGEAQTRWRRRDGTMIDVLLCVSPLYSDDAAEGVVISALDVTEQKKAEEALRASETRYRELADNMPAGIYEATSDGIVQYANNTALEMFGYSAEDVARGMNFLEVISPDELDTLYLNMKRVRHEGSIINHEYTMVRKDGSRFAALNMARPLMREGRVIGSTGVVSDISELRAAQEALRRNEALMKSILRAAPIGVGVVHDRVLGWVNEGMTEMTGYAVDELKGKSARVLYPDEEEFQRAGREKYAEIAARGKGAVETRWKRKGGTILDVHLSSAPIDPANLAAGVVFTAMDITAQKKAARILLFSKTDLELQVAEQTRELDVANMLLKMELEEHRKTEEALVTSEQLYRAIVEDQTEIICRFRPDGTISFVNEAFCRYFEKRRDEVLGTRYFPSIPHDDRRKIWTAYSSLTPHHPVYHLEFRIEMPDGADRWLNWTNRAIYDEKGTIVEHQGVGRDITERKQSEHQIRESRNMLRSVFDGISDPLIMARENMTLIMLNRAALRFFGAMQYRDMIGLPCLDFFQGRYGHEATNLVQADIAKQESARYELATRGDSARYEEVFVYPVHAGEGDRSMAIIRITDRTRQRLMERELIQSEKLASLGLLISGIVHEINNPNNFISFNIPILQDYLQEILPVLDDHAARTPHFEVQGMPYAEFRTDVMKLLENIEHGSTRINTTVAKLKEFSRKKDKKGLRPILPTGVVERAIAICHTQIRKTVKSFDVQVQQDMPEMVSDPDAIEQTLINLLINAAQAADKPDSHIRLKAWREASGMEGLVLEVEDDGCGIDAKTVSRIFDPFFTTKEEGLGTGLGLYISKNLLESVGGSISVESEIGRGATFRVVLPDLGNTDHSKKTVQQKGVRA